MTDLKNVIILDQNQYFETGLNSLINWSKYNLKHSEHKIIVEKNSTFVHFNGILLCDEEIIQTSNDSFVDFLRNRPSNMKLIQTTLHEDVSSLKTALKVKADWVLEKPINIDNLHNILDSLSNTPMKSIAKDEEPQPLNINRLKTYAFGNISNIHNVKKLQKETEFFHEKYFVLHTLYKNKKEQPLFQFLSSFNRLSQIYYEPHFKVLSLQEDKQSMYYILYTDSTDTEVSLRNRLIKQSEELIELVSRNMGIPINISITLMGSKLEDLPNMVKESQNILHETFFNGYGYIFTTKKSTFASKTPLINSYKLDTLFSEIKAGNTGEITGILNDIKEHILVSYNPDKLKEEFINILVLIYSQEINCNNNISNNFGVYINRLLRLDTLDEMFEFLESQCKTVAQSIFDNINVNNTLIINKVLNHIESNYTEPITLESVAKNCYISSSYLSRIFKKIVGENFNEYLTNLRLLNAKRLLLETNYKTYQIAEKVGIYDSNYFSRLFKKNEHMTPSQFRDRNLA